ncbi:hypothetical protein LINGRAHAP2_LOCUS37036 [Linum grandiflorum]
MVVGFKIFLTKNKGFHIFAGSSGLLFDIKQGFSFKGLPAVSQPQPQPQPQPEKSIYISKNDLKSPEKIMEHLIDYGVVSTGYYGVKVNSVKIVKPDFPRNRKADTCDQLLQTYAEAALEMRDRRANIEELEKYCGIVIEERSCYR